MKFPILAYGHPNLRKVAKDITPDYPDLQKLIDDLFESMYQSNGVGLAAPQIDKSIRLFVIDAEPFSDLYDDMSEEEKVRLNSLITVLKRWLQQNRTYTCHSVSQSSTSV